MPNSRLYHESPAYRVWLNMRRRCNDPKRDNYRWYGKRGIRVCERWDGENGYDNFLEDMGQPPNGYTLDRKDNDGNYELGNCEWIPTLENMAKRRKPSNARLITFQGETLTIRGWTKKLGFKRNTLYARLRAGWTVEQALGTSLVSSAESIRRRPPIATAKLISFQGETLSINAWEKKLGIGGNRIGKRLRAGWNVEAAFTVPSNRPNPES